MRDTDEGGPLRFTFRLGRHKVTVKIEQAPDAPGPIPAPAAPGLKELHRRILAAAPAPDERPVSQAQLARRAGYSASGTFREAVRELVDRGLLVRVRAGLRRAAKG